VRRADRERLEAVVERHPFTVDVSEFEERFPGRSHPEVLALALPPTRQVVQNLIEAGTVGTIAALPERFKSWLALEIVLKVAAGGLVLGRFKVVKQGPAGYWWQDDSAENEGARIQEYCRRHDFLGELPIRWHLNEGLRIPDDLPLLREEIEREGQVLVILDSYYNFVPGLELKAEESALVLAAVKSEVCDPTGCAVAVIDHSPWPTEGNEGQRRGYGSVFKAAVIRWGIYLDRKGEALFIEARGNNLRGLQRTPVVWNAERLELQLVEPEGPEADIGQRLAAFLRKNPGATTTVVRAGVQGKDTTIDALLADDDRFTAVPPALFGKPRNATCWARAEDVPDLLNANLGPERADVGPTLARETNDNLGPSPSTTVGGEGEADVGCRPRPEAGRGSTETTAVAAPEPDAERGGGEGGER
jgi:AAA domain